MNIWLNPNIETLIPSVCHKLTRFSATTLFGPHVHKGQAAIGRKMFVTCARGRGELNTCAEGAQGHTWILDMIRCEWKCKGRERKIRKVTRVGSPAVYKKIPFVQEVHLFLLSVCAMWCRVLTL